MVIFPLHKKPKEKKRRAIDEGSPIIEPEQISGIQSILSRYSALHKGKKSALCTGNEDSGASSSTESQKVENKSEEDESRQKQEEFPPFPHRRNHHSKVESEIWRRY